MRARVAMASRGCRRVPAAGAGLALLLAGCAATGPERSGIAPPAAAWVVELRLEADAAYRAREWERARRAYAAVLRAAPDDVTARLRLGNIAFRQGRHDAAREHFRALLARAPRDARARYNLAMTHLAQAEEQLRLYLALRGEAHGPEGAAADEARVLALLAALRRFAEAAPAGSGAPDADPLGALAAALAGEGNPKRREGVLPSGEGKGAVAHRSAPEP